MLHKRSLISKTISMHLMGLAIASTSLVTLAEETTKQKVEETEVITVTGIRGSLVRSLFDKRSAGNVMDGISAEDIGKFPDQNVAESLQRITGVTIDRDESGEGQQISIRGFGPAFNNVLFNGRTMPADNSQRGFSFDLIASELITGADVYKTLRADTLEGGLGGTVNIKTAKPLGYDGFKAAASAKGVYDTLAESTNPFVSALISQNFDDEFGLLASFAYQQRDARFDKAAINGYATTPVYTGSTNDTVTTEKYLRPMGVSQVLQRSDRERIGGTLVAQWQVADNVLLSADVLYSKLEDNKNNKAVSNYYGKNKIYNAEWDEFGSVTSFTRPGTTIVSPGVRQIYQDGTKLAAGQKNAINSNGRNRNSETTMVGFNLDWEATDNFNVVFDFQSSEAVADSKDNPLVSLSAYSETETSFENTGDSFKWSSDAAFDTSLENYTAGNIYYFSPSSKDKITEARIDTEWLAEDMGYLTSVRSGIYYSDRQKNTALYQSRWTEAAKAFGGFPVPASLLSNTTIPFLGDHDQGGFVHTWPDYDAAGIFDYFNSPAALESATFIGDQIINNFENGQTKKNGDPKYATLEAAQAAADKAVAARIEKIQGYIASAPTDGNFGLYNKAADARADRKWQVNEETMAAYVEANLEGEAWSANLGLRYVKTDTSSISAGQIFVGTDAITQGSDILSLQVATGDTRLAEGSYSKLLPSINVKYDINDDLVARFAYSQSLSRPKLSDLTAAQSFSVPSFSEEQGFEGIIKAKNTDLKPFSSANIDLALEWYYAPESYVGGTYFSKSLTDWITTESYQVTLPDTIQNVDREFTTTSPVNVASARVSGLELAVLHNFDNGFGIQANYTMLDTTGAADVESESKVTMYGLSENSYNIIGYYENGPVKLRVAYNWREGYTQCRDCVKGHSRSIDDYGQVDASASYRLTKKVSLIAAVVNLLDEDPLSYYERPTNILSITDTGTRYSLGIRAKF